MWTHQQMQAESDHNVKDTYNYMTIQTDIRMPRRHFSFLEDSAQHQPFQAAISQAVARITAEEDIDCRVLSLGAGAGMVLPTHPSSTSITAQEDIDCRVLNLGAAAGMLSLPIHPSLKGITAEDDIDCRVLKLGKTATMLPLTLYPHQ